MSPLRTRLPLAPRTQHTDGRVGHILLHTLPLAAHIHWLSWPERRTVCVYIVKEFRCLFLSTALPPSSCVLLPYVHCSLCTAPCVHNSHEHCTHALACTHRNRETRTIGHVKLFWRCLFRCRSVCSVGRSTGAGCSLRSAGCARLGSALSGCVCTVFGLCLESALSVRSSNGSRIVTERTIFDHFRTSPTTNSEKLRNRKRRICVRKSKSERRDLRFKLCECHLVRIPELAYPVRQSST